MNNFLLEILVQEMPYAFIPSAIGQLQKAFEKLFDDNCIQYNSIKVYATPRRLAVIINDLASAQPDVEKCVKGPILSIAKDESGKLTPAGIGFKNKNNSTDSDLYEDEGYIWSKVLQKGKTSKEILSENIESIILKLQGAHFMRWGALDTKFTRPVENVLALYNEELLDVYIIDKNSVRTTKGHRYCPNNIIEIKSPKTYLEQMKSVNVIVNQDERKQAIVDLATDKAKEVEAKIDFENNEELLEEITFLTEFPVPVLCKFDEKYLQVPDIVTTTVMSKHQRYFPLYSNKKLLNYFITIANFVGSDAGAFKNIQNGNQRVVTARLEDGIFFYKEDSKTKLDEKLESLKGMTFQKDFGTLYDKTNRLMKICEYMCKEMSLESSDILRTAKLCKADLSTNLVFEFTELQGFIGSIYAKNSSEKPNVSKGILEHYFPLKANGELANGIEGQVVGIADKIDTICTVFLATQGDKKKKRPTGSNDPLGIRRAVLGVLRTIIGNKLNINLTELIKHTLAVLGNEFETSQDQELFDNITDFISSRLVIMLSGDYNKEFLEACLGSTKSGFYALDNLNDYLDRVCFLKEIEAKEDFYFIHENATRISKIIAKQSIPDKINEQKFVNNEERVLYESVMKDEFKTYEQLFNLAKKIETFFDTTLVMDENLEIRGNRFALLKLTENKFNSICDFTKITSK